MERAPVLGAFEHDALDILRKRASKAVDADRRADLGQYFTPSYVANLMASMFDARDDNIRLLDAGAGSGSLFSAVVLDLLSRPEASRAINRIEVTAYEVDPSLAEYLHESMALCKASAGARGVGFESLVVLTDFIEDAVFNARMRLFSGDQSRYTHTVLNPPYGKVAADSPTRKLMKALGVEVGNLYSAFVAACVELLEDGGQLVAITPRSFCNGPYFKAFRKWFLERMSIRHIHVFESRSSAFSDDGVLQENVIFHAVKSPLLAKNVIISSSVGDTADQGTWRTVNTTEVLRPGDRDLIIHIVPEQWVSDVSRQLEAFTASLSDIHLAVSTGKVVDFRARQYLRKEPELGTCPLIYPTHFDHGRISWPRNGSRKPNAIVDSPATCDLTNQAGSYVLVKRFSSKEEKRRVTAAVIEKSDFGTERVAFENHLNFFHRNGVGLHTEEARGLALFLNSTIVDQFFRTFSGHTQVNAADLRKLRYPTLEQLRRLGQHIGDRPGQREIDELVQREFPEVTNVDSVRVQQRMVEATGVLEALGLPRAQQNDRSALALLALLGLGPRQEWSEASNPLMGIQPMLDFARDSYGRNYATGSRETFRRFTVHQFVNAGIVVGNPDDQSRPTNSPQTVYQIEPTVLELLQEFGTANWQAGLAAYRETVITLREKYAQHREMALIPVRFPSGQTLNLTPGGQNVLVQRIIEDFAARFTPGGVPLYVGDTGDKFAHIDRDRLRELGLNEIDEHGKMPDVILLHEKENWLVIVEAVTSHGPVNPKRREELMAMFAPSSAGLVFVTAFLSRKAMVTYLSEIAWETEVWVAEDPAHLIHFDGKRFLGPAGRDDY